MKYQYAPSQKELTSLGKLTKMRVIHHSMYANCSGSTDNHDMIDRFQVRFPMGVKSDIKLMSCSCA